MCADLDLGSGFSLRYTSWSPDRKLNPQYDGLPDVEKHGAIVTCRHGTEGAILLEVGQPPEMFGGHPRWTVESWDPLTLSPSIDAGCCHGFIRNGVWSDA